MSRAVVLASHPEGAVTEQDFAVVDVADTDLPVGFFSNPEPRDLARRRVPAMDDRRRG